MEVRYERPMPDLSLTIAAPLVLDLGDQHGLLVERWCLDGLHPPAGLCATGGAGWLTIPFQGFGITLRVRLSRDDATGLLRFDRLGPREERVLRHFYRALVTGRAVAMDTMITAMDTPVPLVPMAQTEGEAAAQAKRSLPRSARVLTAAAVYAVLGVLAYGPILEPLAREVKAHLAPAAELAGR